MIAELKRRGMISEWEFHFLNGLRALRNEFGHGRAELQIEPSHTNRLRSIRFIRAVRR
jgi:uncharacterized protein YutE (UPF0331/DUF86 family)